jgi:hypothetical protein
VTGALNGLISASRFRRYIISRVISEAATYSVSYVNKATIGYLFDPQVISALALRNRYSLINLQIDVSPVQSESV